MPPRCSFRRCARRSSCISGTRDDDTPSELVDGLVARVPGALRWSVPGAGHGGFGEVDPEGLDATLGGFFDRALERVPGGG